MITSHGLADHKIKTPTRLDKVMINQHVSLMLIVKANLNVTSKSSTSYIEKPHW